MTDLSDHDGNGRDDSKLSGDAWWLRQGRDAPRPRDVPEQPAPSVDHGVSEREPEVEGPVPAPAGDDEIWIVDDGEVEATWSSLEDTITLRAHEARSVIAGIASSGRGSGHPGS